MMIVFRVDASSDVGLGHLSRCMNLAEELRMRGSDVTFVCRDIDSAGTSSLEEKLFRTVLLPRSTDVILQSVDASEFITSLAGARPDWVVVDSYSLGSEWETAVRPFVEKIAVIEDLAGRHHDCDLLIDQNYSDRTVETFKQQVPEKCKFLIGPKYAMLNSIFAKIREVSAAPRNDLKRVFVFCGGSDPKNLTKTVLEALSGDEFSDLAVDVVIGAQNQNFKSGSTNQYDTNIQFHESGDDFAKIMSNSDLAIGAGGTTTWERMCLGVPSVVVSIAENQVPTCEKLGREGFVRYLGPQSEVTNESVASEVREFLKTPSALRASSVKSQIVVDGKGCKRVAEAMCPTSEDELKVRLATKPDCRDYFNWANDPQVRENSLDSADIEWTRHQKWFTEKINSESTEMCVLEASGLPVGQIRFEIVDKTAEINYSLDELVRGRGWAATAIDLSVKCFRNRNAIPLKAVVKNRNARSRSTFFKLGFTEVSAESPPLTPQFSIALISDETSWFDSYLREFKFELLQSGHKVMHVHNENELKSADLCFYLSYSKIATKNTLSKFKNNLVVHSSDLPNGRGWSPLTWQILEGKKMITTSLFEAVEDVDRGKIYLQKDLELSGFELLDELHMLQGDLIISMCSEFIQTYPDVLLRAQVQEGEGSFYSRRRPADSELNPDISIREQLNLFRVADNINYPAYVEIDQHHYEFWIKKKDEK